MTIEHVVATSVASGDVLRVNMAPTPKDDPQYEWRTVTQVRTGTEIVAITIEGAAGERQKVVTHVVTLGCRMQVCR